MSFNESFMGRASALSWRTLRGKLSWGNSVNNGTRGQPDVPFAGNPCNFNAIGAVTGTQRASESRTEEQEGKGRAWGPGRNQVGTHKLVHASAAPRKPTAKQ